jgi:transposase
MASEISERIEQMKSVKNFSNIYMCINPIDFRKGVYSISALVQSEFNLSPFCGELFLFTNKKRDSINRTFPGTGAVCLNFSYAA